jgi:hypothetical protein
MFVSRSKWLENRVFENRHDSDFDARLLGQKKGCKPEEQHFVDSKMLEEISLA